MATPKSRLGRGLGALINSGTTPPKAAPTFAPKPGAGGSPQGDTGSPDSLPSYREEIGRAHV